VVTVIAAVHVILNLCFKNKHDFFMIRASSHSAAVSGAPIASFAWWSVGHLMIYLGLLPAFVVQEWRLLHLIWLLPVSVPISIWLGATALKPFWEREPQDENDTGDETLGPPVQWAVLGFILVAASWLSLFSEAKWIVTFLALFALWCFVTGGKAGGRHIIGK
jgi:hypothetical protein